MFLETRDPISEMFQAFSRFLDPFPEFPYLDMTLNAMSHMTLFDKEAPIIASSTIHGSSAPTHGEDPNDDMDLNYMYENIFDDIFM